MSEVAIRVQGVSKDFKLPHEKSSSIKSSLINFRKRGYEVQHALKDVTFEIKEGEFFGIVGRNGSGKSTLLKILAGIYQPTKGSVEVRGKLVPFIELGVGFNPELTGRDNVYLNGALMGFSEKEVSKMYKDIVDFAELERFMDQKLKNYSSGMQVRLAFSMAVRSDADILLIDEVLAVGDAAFQRKCFEYFKTLKKNKKTVVFVSHDMGSIREFCDRALLIDSNHIKDIGKPGDIANKYSQLFIQEEAETKAGQPEMTINRDGKRWGSNSIKIIKADAKLAGDHLQVKVKANVKKHLESVIFGLHVTSLDGEEVTAMNNRMILIPDLTDLKAGSKVEFEWEMLNIFNDGKYYITLTLVDDAGLAFDWYTDAVSFTVNRRERSTTPILPPVKVKYKIT